jgi:hypothetical protein
MTTKDDDDIYDTGNKRYASVDDRENDMHLFFSWASIIMNNNNNNNNSL